MIGQGPIAILVFIYGTCRPIYKRENMSIETKMIYREI